MPSNPNYCEKDETGTASRMLNDKEKTANRSWRLLLLLLPDSVGGTESVKILYVSVSDVLKVI